MQTVIPCCHSAALREALCAELHLICRLRLVYLVREVVAVHLVAVRLTSWTLNLNAMALQDGCFFKNTNAIIAYRPQNNNALRCKQAVTRSKTDEQELSRSLLEDNHKQPILQQKCCTVAHVTLNKQQNSMELINGADSEET